MSLSQSLTLSRALPDPQPARHTSPSPRSEYSRIERNTGWPPISRLLRPSQQRTPVAPGKCSKRARQTRTPKFNPLCSVVLPCSTREHLLLYIPASSNAFGPGSAPLTRPPSEPRLLNRRTRVSALAFSSPSKAPCCPHPTHPTQTERQGVAAGLQESGRPSVCGVQQGSTDIKDSREQRLCSQRQVRYSTSKDWGGEALGRMPCLSSPGTVDTIGSTLQGCTYERFPRSDWLDAPHTTQVDARLKTSRFKRGKGHQHTGIARETQGQQRRNVNRSVFTAGRTHHTVGPGPSCHIHEILAKQDGHKIAPPRAEHKVPFVAVVAVVPCTVARACRNHRLHQSARGTVSYPG